LAIGFALVYPKKNKELRVLELSAFY